MRLLVFLLLSAYVIKAETPHNAHIKPHNYKEERGGCSIPVDQFDMDVNDVRARLLDAGDLWWEPDSFGVYQVPKGAAGYSRQMPQAIFAGSIWVSALDQGNNLHLAALEYREGTSDYYTGPLDNNGNVTPATCNLWDQHFPVFSSDIIPCINAYQASGNISVPMSIVVSNPRDSNVIRWPGKGNPYLAAEGYDVSGILAPFYDANGDGIYNPLDGDYPSLKQFGIRPQGAGCDSLIYGCSSAYADEMVFWVMNDAGNTHTVSSGSPLGIQVNALAFEFQDTNEINQMTFYTYNVINKSGTIYNQTYISQWTDVDLGCANNDRVGCDTSRNLAIQYNGYVSGGTQQNGVSCDEGNVCPTGEVGYGCDLPMIGIEILQGATDTTINPATQLPTQLGMTKFWYFTNGAATGQGDPTAAVEYRNYQTGFWADGSPFTYGGTGYGGTSLASYSFPGDPSISSQWSECYQQTPSDVLQSGDRRFVQTSGPFTFMPCGSQFFTIAVVFVDPPGGVGSNCPSWSYIDAAADKATTLFNACFQHVNPIPLAVQDISANSMKVYPNPVSSLLYFDPSGQPIDNVSVYDLMGRLVIAQSGHTKSVDMSGLSDGVYFVQTNTGSGQTFKIVKK